MDEKIIEFAPIIIIILAFIWQNKIFVKPEELEKKHREILNDMKQSFVELNAYKEFQTHVLKEFENVKDEMTKGFGEIKEILKARRKEDL